MPGPRPAVLELPASDPALELPGESDPALELPASDPALELLALELPGTSSSPGDRIPVHGPGPPAIGSKPRESALSSPIRAAPPPRRGDEGKGHVFHKQSPNF